jgi:hypothetical protein
LLVENENGKPTNTLSVAAGRMGPLPRKKRPTPRRAAASMGNGFAQKTFADLLDIVNGR